MNIIEIFEQYKTRLLNLTGRNPTLRLSKLYKKNAFDLASLDIITPGITDTIYDYLLKPTTSPLVILECTIAQQKVLSENIKTTEIDLFEHKNKKNEAGHKLIYLEHLKKLKKDIEDTEKETGLYELYVALPFVEGCLLDETYIRAPLLLFQVRIIVDTTTVSIAKIQDEPFINQVFIVAYKQKNEALFDISNLEIPEIANLNSIYDFYESIGIKNIIRDNSPEFKIFNHDHKHEQKNALKANNYLILGKFKVSNSIHADYENLIKRNAIDHSLLLKLLGNINDEIKETQETNSEKSEYNEINETECHFVSELDYSQEKAIMQSFESNGVVIYGPPGTGKSQTIANIISDALAKKQRVLMVSQKRAALDVIYNRLAKISDLVLLLHNSQKEKGAFYDKLKDVIANFVIHANKSKELENISGEINRNIAMLEKLNLVLNSPQDFGLSLNQLYRKSNQSILKNSNDKNTNLYMRIANKFENVTYNEIEQAIFIAKANVDDYYFYKNNTDAINILNKLKSDVDNVIIDISISKLEHFIDQTKKIKSKDILQNELLYQAVMEDMRLKNFDINEFSQKLSTILCKPKYKLLSHDFTKHNLYFWLKSSSDLGIEHSEFLELFKPNIDFQLFKTNLDAIFVLIEHISKQNLDELIDDELLNEIKSSVLLSNINIPKLAHKSNIKLNKSKYQNLNLKKYNFMYWVKLKTIKKEIERFENDKLILLERYNTQLCSYKQYISKFDFLDCFFRSEFVNNLIIKYANSTSNEVINDLNKIKTDFHCYLTYFEKYNKEKANYASDSHTLLNEISEQTSRYKSFIEQFQFLENLFDSDIFSGLVKKFLNNGDIHEEILELNNAFKNYRPILTTKNNINNLNQLVIEVLDFCYTNKTTKEELIDDINNLLNLILIRKINNIEKALEKELNIHDEFTALKDKTIQLMKKKKELIPDYIFSKWRQFSIDNLKDFKWQINKKSKLWQIRKLIKVYSTNLFSLCPCWLVSPESASDILPLQKELFDIVIFDESSQMFIENALPAIYRGKKVIIAGDDKQLRPNALFKSKNDNEFENDDDDETDYSLEAALEVESLLDMAKKSFDGISLKYHYRSKHGELIDFSNYAFYRGELEISPNIINNRVSNEPPIEFIKVNGIWIDRKNSAEAEEIVNLIEKLLVTRQNNETIGVITFNETQKDHILDKIDDRCKIDENFNILYNQESTRNVDSEDKSLFVKNIENVQGDERDIIIFSIGYSKDRTGRIINSFGSLNQDGGENRLNVAISRAKEKIYVITSVEPEEFNVSSSKNRGPKLFVQYLRYARAISNKSNEAQEILNFLLIKTNEKLVPFDSEFEVEVYNELIKHGYYVENQVGSSGYKIDLAIYDEKLCKYILGIECDGYAYHSSKSARERDIYRQMHLESVGWQIHRIWSRDWWRDPNNEINRIKNQINSLKIS